MLLPVPTPALPPTQPRLASLDVFRGLTIAAMVIVNNPGSWDHVYSPLDHAEWNGCTPTDLIFPFFLFIVGASMGLSKSKPATSRVWFRMLRRAGTLFALGLMLNASSMMVRREIDWSHLRFMGVLQRIALCYAAAFALTRVLRATGQVAFGATLLLGHAALLRWASTPGSEPGTLTPDGNFSGWIDRLTIGTDHIYKHGPMDPEGLLGTLTATVTVLMGYWTVLIARRRSTDGASVTGHRLGMIVSLGGACVLAGWMWENAAGLPINKQLWTGSYVLFTGGCAMISLALCMVVIDRWNWRRLGRPLEVLGMNAILLFVGSGLGARVLAATRVGEVDGKPVTLARWIYDQACVPVAGPLNGSLLFATATLAFWWMVLYPCWRRRWFWKI